MSKYTPVLMIKKHLSHSPMERVTPPAGYRLRTFRKGDELVWTQLQTAAGQFDTPELAYRRFVSQFKPYLDKLENRCFFLETKQGQAIGTATAWSGYLEGRPHGQLAWLSLAPAYQGRQLSKPLVSVVLHRLSKEYQSVYLTTCTTNYRAVNLYLKFGFEPYRGQLGAWSGNLGVGVGRALKQKTPVNV